MRLLPLAAAACCLACRASDSSAADSKDSAFLAGVEVHAVPPVPAISQSRSNDCWAAAYTMLVSWKQGRLLKVDEVLLDLGEQWVALYEKDEGLPAQNHFHRSFLEATGLKAEPPANYTLLAYVDMLIEHGPLWINANVGTMNHARILVGAVTSPSDQRVMFSLLDPRDGSIHSLLGEEFAGEFESEARMIVDNDLDWEFRYQILHW